MQRFPRRVQRIPPKIFSVQSDGLHVLIIARTRYPTPGARQFSILQAPDFNQQNSCLIVSPSSFFAVATNSPRPIDHKDFLTRIIFLTQEDGPNGRCVFTLLKDNTLEIFHDRGAYFGFPDDFDQRFHFNHHFTAQCLLEFQRGLLSTMRPELLTKWKAWVELSLASVTFPKTRLPPTVSIDPQTLIDVKVEEEVEGQDEPTDN